MSHWLSDTCAGREIIEGVGVDHYPGTWTLGAWDDWSPLSWLLSETEGGAWDGLSAGVLETGYASRSRFT